MTRDEWIEVFAKELGLPAPPSEQADAILEPAATAAHGSERTAAPIAAWLAGVSGRSLDEVNELARRASGAEGGAGG